MFLRDVWILFTRSNESQSWKISQLIGTLILFPSLFLWALARFQLARCCTLLPVAEELITKGLYSRFRNPVYLFGSLTMIGYFLFYDHPEGILCMFIIVPLQYYRASQESIALESRFGESYHDYVKTVWM
jgi:protein-S-isoprenylcysteine O-methyltransferase Ste14